MKTLCLILLLLQSTLPAQTLINIEAGVNSRAGMVWSTGLSPYLSWKSATDATIGIDHFLKQSVAISANLEYDLYPYDTYRDDGTAFPDILVKSSSGEASRVYRISLEGKFFARSHGPLSIYLVTGASYTIERIGQQILTMTDFAGSDFQRTIPSQLNYYWLHVLGLGARYSISDHLAVDISGKSYSNYTTRTHQSLNMGILCSL